MEIQAPIPRRFSALVRPGADGQFDEVEAINNA
jgi:hypothetical protein